MQSFRLAGGAARFSYVALLLTAACGAPPAAPPEPPPPPPSTPAAPSAEASAPAPVAAPIAAPAEQSTPPGVQGTQAARADICPGGAYAQSPLAETKATLVKAGLKASGHMLIGKVKKGI